MEGGIWSLESGAWKQGKGIWKQDAITQNLKNCTLAPIGALKH
jgi:hypothetical protein